MATPEQLCRDIADGGFFVAWDQPAAKGVHQDAPKKPEPEPIYTAAVPSAVMTLGGSPRSHFTEQTEGGNEGNTTTPRAGRGTRR